MTNYGRPRRSRIASAALLLASLTAASQVLGLIRDSVLAATFGAGADLDAYLVAQGVMNLVLAMVAGAMSRALVPPVSRAAAAGDTGRAHRTVQTGLTVTVLVLVMAGAIVFVAAGQVVSVLAPGFDSDQVELATTLTRVVLGATALVAATDILAAAAQSHGRFFHSGAQGVAFNLVMIAATAFFGTIYGITAVAAGFVVASAARLAIQFPAVRRIGLRLRPRLDVRDADFREVLRLTPALLVGSAVVNVNTLVDRAVGSSQGEGTIAALSLGWRVTTLVDSLLVATAVAALYPAFSSLGEPTRRAELRSLVDRALSAMLVLLTPAVVLLFAAAQPLVTLAFGRGAFGAEDISMTSIAVTGYAASAVGIAVRSVASRAFFAVGDSRTPVLMAVLAMVVNVVGDLTLGIAYGVWGLAISTTVSLLVGAVGSVTLLARRHAAVSLGMLASSAGRIGLAGLLAGTSCWAVLVWTSPGPAGDSLPVLVQLTAAGLAVLATYTCAMLVLGRAELRDLAAVAGLRFGRGSG